MRKCKCSSAEIRSCLGDTTRDKIFKVDYRGRLLWVAPVPEKFGSHSTIFINEGLLYVINDGSGFNRTGRVKYGKRFLAIHDKNTGEEKLFRRISEQIDGIIKNYVYSDNKTKLLVGKTIVTVSDDGDLRWDGSALEHLKEKKVIGLLDDLVYNQLGDGRYVSTNSLYENNYHVVTSDNMVYRLKENLAMAASDEVQNPWILKDAFKDKEIISNNNSTIVLNSEGRPILEISGCSEYSLVDSSIWFVDGEKLNQIDLNKL